MNLFSCDYIVAVVFPRMDQHHWSYPKNKKTIIIELYNFSFRFSFFELFYESLYLLISPHILLIIYEYNYFLIF